MPDAQDLSAGCIILGIWNTIPLVPLHTQTFKAHAIQTSARLHGTAVKVPMH